MKKKPKHPLIREIQLGKSVKDVIDEHFSELSIEGLDTEARLEEIVKEIIRINKNDLRFAVVLENDSCDIIVLNDSQSELVLDYWDHTEGFALDEMAREDCETINEVVERLYGTKRKKAKAKITKTQFLKKNGDICPYCGRTPTTLDETTWSNRDIMGCSNCGEIWAMYYKTVATGFER